MRRLVVVLGGNAFAASGAVTMAGQLEFAHASMACLEPILDSDTQLLISHGNGPQVGHILTRVERSLGEAYSIPLEVCVAESEGELGYVLDQALRNVLAERGLFREVVALLTQVVVREDDPAFQHPTKPIGPALDPEHASKLQEQQVPLIADLPRGLRRAVASPQPLRVLGLEVMRSLLQDGVIVVAGGGGGIPVLVEQGRLRGVEAVIDKDLTGALLAEQLHAHQLIILTCVPCAYRHFATPKQQPIGTIDLPQAKSLLAEGHFAEGTMRPKIAAAIQYSERTGNNTLICDPPSLAAALRGEAGTRIQAG